MGFRTDYGFYHFHSFDTHSYKHVVLHLDSYKSFIFVCCFSDSMLFCSDCLGMGLLFDWVFFFGVDVWVFFVYVWTNAY